MRGFSRSRRGSWIATVIAVVAMASFIHADEIGPFLVVYNKAERVVHNKADRQATRKEWSAAAGIYGSFVADHPDNPYVPLACILQGIMLCRELKDTDKARDAFEQAVKAPETPLGREFKFAAQAWLARFRMEEVDKALRKYYIDEVEYPAKLEELVERKLLDDEKLVDPWGKHFSYRAKRVRIAPGVPRQTYRLSSSSIRGDSRKFSGILKESATFERAFQLKGVTTTVPITAVLTPTGGSGKSVKTIVGAMVGTAKVIEVSREAVILVDDGMVAVVTQ